MTPKRLSNSRTSDALEIIDTLYFNGRPELEQFLVEAEERLFIAEQLQKMREERTTSQDEVALRDGTKRSGIARLEKPGYE